MSFLLPSWTSLCFVLRPVSATNNLRIFLSKEKPNSWPFHVLPFQGMCSTWWTLMGQALRWFGSLFGRSSALCGSMESATFQRWQKNFCHFLWKLFIPGHITDDWLATVYPDQSLLGFCLSCCPAGEINFKALSFFNCKRESVFIMHVTTGYIHPLPGLLEYAPLQPNGKKAVPLFVPSLKYYSWSLYCLLSCNICHLPMFCIKNQKLIDVFMAYWVVKFVTSQYFVFTL